jgi:hypothetical protein
LHFFEALSLGTAVLVFLRTSAAADVSFSAVHRIDDRKFGLRAQRRAQRLDLRDVRE